MLKIKLLHHRLSTYKVKTIKILLKNLYTSATNRIKNFAALNFIIAKILYFIFIFIFYF